MISRRATLIIALLALAPQTDAFGESPSMNAEGFRPGQLECSPLSKGEIEQKCNREAFEFPQQGRVDGWRIVLVDRNNQSWSFSRADVMLAHMPASQTPIRVPDNDTESGVRH